MDNGSSFENAGFGESSTRGYNQFAPQLNYGDSAFDVRQRLVFSPIYVTPTVRRASDWYNPINLALRAGKSAASSPRPPASRSTSPTRAAARNSLWCPYFTNFYACPDAPNQVAPIQTAIRASATRRLSGSQPVHLRRRALATSRSGSSATPAATSGHGPGINNTNMVLAKNFTSPRIAASVSSAHGERQRLQPYAVHQPRDDVERQRLTNANSSFGYISGTQPAVLPSWRRRFTSKPSCNPIPREAPSGAFCFYAAERLRKADRGWWKDYCAAALACSGAFMKSSARIR